MFLCIQFCIVRKNHLENYFQSNEKVLNVALTTDSKWSLNFIEEFAITSLFKVSYAKFQTCSNSDRPPLCNDLVNFSHYFHFKLRAKPTPFRHKMHILKKCAMRIICSVILTKKPYIHICIRNSLKNEFAFKYNVWLYLESTMAILEQLTLLTY